MADRDPQGKISAQEAEASAKPRLRAVAIGLAVLRIQPDRLAEIGNGGVQGPSLGPGAAATNTVTPLRRALRPSL